MSQIYQIKLQRRQLKKDLMYKNTKKQLILKVIQKYGYHHKYYFFLDYNSKNTLCKLLI